MFTDKNTPLYITLVIAAIILAIAAMIASSLIWMVAFVLAGSVIYIGMLSRKMTHMWLTDDVRLWHREIQRFERSDAKEMPPKGLVEFVGSSTIKYWSTLNEDMAPIPIIRRGFGGSRILDAVYYADRIVIPYEPTAIVLFSGTNDIAGKLPKTPDYVAQKFVEFCDEVHKSVPEAPIYYLSINPTPGRTEHWPAVQKANQLIDDYAQNTEFVHFIDTTTGYLDDNGNLKKNLFRRDKIHLNAKGYEILTSIVKPILMKDLADKLGIR